MNVRQIRAILWALAALLTVSAVASALLLLLPSDPPRIEARGGDEPGAAAPSQAVRDEIPTLDAFEPILAATFDEPLVRPAPEVLEEPAPEPAPAAASASVPFRLAGTVGTTLAVLRADDGRIEVRRVGQSVDGVEILSVEAGRATVRHNGQVHLLEREPQVMIGRISGT
jgi:hypothetical protein